MTENLTKIYIDLETYYNTKEKYTLKKMSLVEYVRDPKFKIHGLGYAIDTSSIRWVSKKNIPQFIESIDWNSVTIIAHNAKFDGFILSEKYGVSPAQWIDTKSMSRAVHAHARRIKGHSLNHLAEHYNLPHKGMMKTDGIRDLTSKQEKELAEYCIHDVRLCRQIEQQLQKEFPSSQYKSMDWAVRTFVKPRLYLNVPLLEQTAKREAKEKKELFEGLDMDPILFRSNLKFAVLLTQAGFKVPSKISPRTQKQIPALALGDEAFQDMLNSTDEKLKILCKARVVAKSTIMETRSIKLAAIGKTGRWPFDIQFSGAMNTHRYSGGNGAGGNPQNFVRDSALREAVIPPKKFDLIVGDFAGIELRIVAFLAKDPLLMQSIRDGEDEYCKFASEFYKRDITKKDENERNLGKQAILGLGYGMGWSKFKHTVKIKTEHEPPCSYS